MKIGSALLVSLALACALGVPRPAAADDAAAREQARAAYLRGKAHYDAGRFERAVRELKRAYSLQRMSPLLRYTADAYYAMKRHRLALGYYRQYLERARFAEDKAEVGRRIRELEAALSSDEEEAVVGARRVAVAAPDGRDRELPRELGGAQLVDQPARRSPVLRVAKWSALVASVAGLALGITYNRLARSRADELENAVRSACPEENPGCGGNPGLDRPVAAYGAQHYALERDIERYRNRSIVFFIAGGVSAGASAVLFYLDRRRAARGRASSSLALQPYADARSLGVAGEVSF